MKKFYSLVAALAITGTITAQINVFNGADFEDWAAFESSLNSFGIKSYATQGVGLGYNNTNSLNISTSGASGNDYVFTSKAAADLPPSIEKITLMVKGSSAKSLSFNLYKTTLDSKGRQEYYVFNLGDFGDSNVTLESSGSNQYTGTINTNGEWREITLKIDNLADINLTDTSKDLFALKVGKGAKYDLNIDDIKIYDKKMNVYDLAGNKLKNLVKNTVVDTQLLFGTDADIKIYNVNGQLVKSAKVNNGEALNLSSLPKGVYIVSGEVNGEKVSQKIIKK
ncbi:T9SS type A sorting domain-containing protein [Riemerella anatipestifer]|nr:T9SS type A sorting domain-containing protein [Riemerella anatipestifer]MDY3324434.1 T9SS type A sorting domain-containing protein [Riemerella anatipestifer]MDY3353249.1 T9SS type A sorting domain-containing protein [Riemerella anatipestifer]